MDDAVKVASCPFCGAPLLENIVDLVVTCPFCGATGIRRASGDDVS